MEKQLKENSPSGLGASKPNLSKQAFWDVEINGNDFKNYADFIIGRIFEFGTVDDIREVIKFYGKEKSIIALTNAEFLRQNAISIAHLLLDIPKENFKCYTNRPSHIPF
jgi:hypothetical protein